ncbi:MAG TPA: LLM class flavin-dependent oxidoreductase [Thermomicrobiaceae bacterium]|nr:LLM class flavin-dependent oxidoreductase [Thermomicrobiaceae bacterium]
MLPIGIKTSQPGATFAELAAAWRAADECGFAAGWIYDHLTALGDPNAPTLECWTLLAALATQTRRLRLGVLVTDNALRHPAMLAREAVTVDQISGGRLEMGLGAGNPRSEPDYRAYGIPAGSLGERISRLGESCRVLKLLWTEEEASFSGRYYQLDHARPAIWPLQRPHPPITIGGKGDRVLRVTARYADRWNYIGPFEGFVEAVARLRATCEQVGRDIATLTLTAQISVDDQSPTQARETIARYQEAGAQMLIAGLPLPYTEARVTALAEKLFG